MDEFYPFFLIILAGVFFSMVFRRMHVPWVVGLILGGVLMGPHVLDMITITPVTEFISQLGLVFLMFMAGLESKFSHFDKFQGKLLWLSFINGAVPFLVGLVIALGFGYEMFPSLLIGVVFISSSIAIVIPSLERHNLLNTRLGQSVVMTSVIQDIGSLVVLSVILQSASPVTSLPLWVFYPLVILVLLILKFLLPKVHMLFTIGVRDRQDYFQQEFRAVFLMLLGTVMAFEFLGLHPIIAGFFAGLVLSGPAMSDVLKSKVRTISYGVFIPTFFLLIGVQTDLVVLFSVKSAMILTAVIVLGSIASKFLSGWFGAISVGFDRDSALLFAISAVPQLSTTLAVAFTAFSLGLIDQDVVTAMVALSVVTVMVSPMLMNILGDRIRRSIGQSA